MTRFSLFRLIPRLLILLGALLVTDAIYVMWRGVFHFGSFFPLTVGLALVLAGSNWLRLRNWFSTPTWRRWLWRLGWSATLAWVGSVAVFFWHIQHGYQTDLASIGKPVDTILILGSGTLDCQASPTLAARLDAGIIQAQRLPQAMIMVSGGKDWRRDCTEAQIMGDYLRAHGIPAARIWQEERSTSTYENFAFSSALLQQYGVRPEQGLLIVTSDFHSLRSARIAQRAGFRHTASASAETPLYLRYNAWLREYFSFISGYLLNEY
ncbi:YdcF family protein [Undibacterium rugosum]|nr:YdcF family protein [Undibacterium rugosum]